METKAALREMLAQAVRNTQPQTDPKLCLKPHEQLDRAPGEPLKD